MLITVVSFHLLVILLSFQKVVGTGWVVAICDPPREMVPPHGFIQIIYAVVKPNQMITRNLMIFRSRSRSRGIQRL